MKAQDILPDQTDSVTINGVTVRKGSVAAFVHNVNIVQDSNVAKKIRQLAEADLIALLPALQQLGIFDVFSVRSTRVRLVMAEHGMAQAGEEPSPGVAES